MFFDKKLERPAVIQVTDDYWSTDDDTHKPLKHFHYNFSASYGYEKDFPRQFGFNDKEDNLLDRIEKILNYHMNFLGYRLPEKDGEFIAINISNTGNYHKGGNSFDKFEILLACSPNNLDDIFANSFKLRIYPEWAKSSPLRHVSEWEEFRTSNEFDDETEYIFPISRFEEIVSDLGGPKLSGLQITFFFNHCKRK